MRTLADVSEAPPVFFDPAGRRRRSLTRLAAAAGAAALAALALAAMALRQPETLPALHLTRRATPTHPLLPASHATGQADVTRWTPRSAPTGGPLNVTGFFVAWDDNSLSSLKRNLGTLDALVPEWWHLGPDGALQPESPGKNARMLDFVRATRATLPIFPLVNNYDPQRQAWADTRAARVLHDPARRSALVRALTAGVRAQGFAGLNLDFENLPPTAQADYVHFVTDLAGALHRAGARLTVDVPLDDPAFAYAALGRAADSVVLMAYDQHEDTSAPGPVAAQGWVQRLVAERAGEVPPAKLTVALGSYGYDWSRGAAGELSFQDALSLARDAGVRPHLDPSTLNPTFQYAGDHGEAHTVWYLDAVSVYDQAQAARALGVAHVAVWRLGSEDPGVWAALRQRGAALQRALATVQAGYDIDYQGQGELLKVSGHPQPGTRQTTLEARSGLLTAETMGRFPVPYVIQRWGSTNPRQVALTFDDGPDPRYTPAILDILTRAHVNATFFVVGLRGEANPDLLRRIVAQGSELGSHTFTHPDLSLISTRQFNLELRATQRLIEGATGRRTVLFRPPFAEDIEPETPDQAGIVAHASRLGYYISGMGVDPNDWKRPGAAQIVASTLAQVRAGDGQVILLHDAGGDRTETVAALPALITALRAQGYSFTTVSGLAGISREQANPRVSVGERWAARVMGASFSAIGTAGALLGLLFRVGVALSVGRLALIVGLALRERLRPLALPDGPLPSVGVIVPAFNEARVIRATVASLLASDLPDVQVYVVDDGSTDGTADVVRAAYGTHPRVTVERMPNGGKARALNHALARLETEVVMLLDADTQVNPEAARRLARHFLAPQVMAVAGNAKVGNRVNLLTRWQALEYITAQNVERRALGRLNAISVVPGAIGAWRRDALLRLGGFTHDTLAEDADLTMRALRAGYRVTYELGAVARTEAPETLRAFLKQRDRWMFGTLQASWKQRGALGGRARGLGWFTLPNVLLFQVLSPLVGAALDLSFVGALAWAALQWQYHPDAGFAPSGPVLLYSGLFILIDLLAGAVAFALEGGEDWRLLPLLLPQRVVYRQLMSYVAIRAVFAALSGQRRGWGTLERTGSVTATVRPATGAP